MDAADVDVLHGASDDGGHFLRRLDRVAGDVDRAQEHVLALEEAQELHRHLGVDAFERDLVDAACRERGEDLLVLAPLAAQALLPVDVRLDAVAVADVHRGLGADAVDRAVQRLDAPVLHVLHVDVEGGLVELDHVDAECGKLARLGVEAVREGKGHLHAVAIVAVGDGVDDGHRARQRELEPPARVGAGERRLGRVHGAAAPERPRHRRHLRLVAVVADPHGDFLRVIDAVDLRQEAVDEVDAAHLAVAHDVDAGVLLHLEREERGVGLRLGERVGALRDPRRPEHLGLREPGGLRQAAGNGGLEHDGAPLPGSLRGIVGRGGAAGKNRGRCVLRLARQAARLRMRGMGAVANQDSSSS